MNIEKLSDKSISRGCIVLENRDMLKLLGFVRKNRTPVIISNNFKDIKLISAKCTKPDIRAVDGTVSYRITSSGLSSSDVLYQVLK